MTTPILQMRKLRLTEAKRLARWPMRNAFFEPRFGFLIHSTKPHPVPEILPSWSASQTLSLLTTEPGQREGPLYPQT